MKYQQISVDFISMVFTACSYLALAGAVWIFLRLIQACFSLPRQLKRQNHVQQMLQDKVENYEKYILECEKRELAEQEMKGEDAKIDPDKIEKWKERRECLEMLKKELSKVRDGVDEPFDWDNLLEEVEEEEEDEATKKERASITEIKEDTSDDKHDDKLNADLDTIKLMNDSGNKKYK